ncbi:MAG TPA: PhzF family phenazine biosynthesis protein [Stellaceae bacterium]|nr:PhzF family phenazine biosynthesis protein [Stellaceae bacterium]
MSIELPIYQVDAFTSALFGGNPAAIVPLESWLDDELMLKIAAENNLAETAFIVAQGEGYGIRWFTPTVEMDLCGHATLAAAFVIFEFLRLGLRCVRFSTKVAGELRVKRREDGRLELDFPARPPKPLAAFPGLAQALGAVPRELHKSRDVVAVFDAADDVARLKPDFRALAALDTQAVIVTAKGRDGIDFVSRFFAPGIGVDEDPVTGSAHCTLIPFWANRLGKTQLTARQLSPRIGDLLCTAGPSRVGIAGHAVLYMRGHIYIA